MCVTRDHRVIHSEGIVNDALRVQGKDGGGKRERMRKKKGLFLSAGI